MARAVGARGTRVENIEEFKTALADALTGKTPYVIDAIVDRDDMAPTLERRVRTLAGFFDGDPNAKRRRADR